MLPPPLRRLRIGLAASCAAAAVFAGAYIAYVMPDVPTDEDLFEVRIAEPSTLLSADGKPLATYRRAQQKRGPGHESSPHAIQGPLAPPDRPFFFHPALDPPPLAKAPPPNAPRH